MGKGGITGNYASEGQRINYNYLIHSLMIESDQTEEILNSLFNRWRATCDVGIFSTEKTTLQLP
jgi:hypothetical protein